MRNVFSLFSLLIFCCLNVGCTSLMTDIENPDLLPVKATALAVQGFTTADPVAYKQNFPPSQTASPKPSLGALFRHGLSDDLEFDVSGNYVILSGFLDAKLRFHLASEPLWSASIGVFGSKFLQSDMAASTEQNITISWVESNSYGACGSTSIGFKQESFLYYLGPKICSVTIKANYHGQDSAGTTIDQAYQRSAVLPAAFLGGQLTTKSTGRWDLMLTLQKAPTNMVTFNDEWYPLLTLSWEFSRRAN